MGEAIAALILPQAQGGNGELSYTLEPAVPGLRFDPGTRVLAGTPSLAGSYYGMSYRAEDGDGNRAASDAATASFTITVEEAEPEGILDTYRGSGDQIFMLNRAGESLDGTPYTLVLDDEASAEVYLIATNTNDYEVQPRVERLDDAVPVATSQRLPANASRRASRVGSDSMMHARPWLLEFNNSLPPPRISTVSPELPPRQAVREGDTYTFYDTYADGGFRETAIPVPATARRVVTDGAMTLVVWVADQDWGSCLECVRQAMVDGVTGPFLRPGPNNDIYDWLTAVFGAPWGPHDHSSFLIPAEYADEIHIVIYDIQGAGGYFAAVDTNLRDPDAEHIAIRYSNERLLFALDAPAIARHEGPSWEVTDYSPSNMVLSLAHEFQHMIHHYQKQVKYNFEPVHDAWLHEMSSLVAEDLIADKLALGAGPRGVAHDDPTAGRSRIAFGRLPVYNYYNYLQASVWEFDPPLYRYYSVSYALGAYLARNYGGAPLFGAIVQSNRTGTEAIEAALRAHGHAVSFPDLLVDWAVANLLSDDTAAPFPYRYNSGTWSTSQVGGIAFRLGSINLFNYRYYYGDDLNDYHDGPYFYRLLEFDNAGAQPPHSNRYATLGRTSGTVRMRIDAVAGNRITVVVKE